MDLDLLAARAREDALVEVDGFDGVGRFDFLNNNILDLNTDQFINDVDRQLWLTHVAKTSPGDSDLDGDVDFVDFLGLANNFGQSPSSWSQGDFDGNNEANFLDFLALANNFGNESVADVAAVPEPSSTLLGLVAASLLLCCRRRR